MEKAYVAKMRKVLLIKTKISKIDYRSQKASKEKAALKNDNICICHKLANFFLVLGFWDKLEIIFFDHLQKKKIFQRHHEAFYL